VHDISTQENSRYQTTDMGQTGAKIIRSAWQQDYPDPQDYVSLLIRHGESYAITGWNNGTFNQLTRRADAEPNRAKRAQLYIAAQKIVLSQAVFVPLFNLLGFALVKPYVHGIVGGSAYANLQPTNGDWSKVTISKH